MKKIIGYGLTTEERLVSCPSMSNMLSEKSSKIRATFYFEFYVLHSYYMF
jgi:hypothetical protein